MSDWQQDVETVREIILEMGNGERTPEEYDQSAAALDRLVARIAELERERDEAREALRGLSRHELGRSFGRDAGLCWCDPFYHGGDGEWPGHDEECSQARAALDLDPPADPDYTERVHRAWAELDPEPLPPADTDRHPPQAMSEHDWRL